jgi:hypothetical protein
VSVEAPSADICQQIDNAASSWWQADIAKADSFASFTFENTTSESGRSEIQLVANLDRVQGLVVLSQTCDIRRSSNKRPYVHVSPVVLLDGSDANLAKKGKLLRFIPVPGGGTQAFADTDRIMTVNKALFLNCTRTPGCNSDEERRIFGRRLGRVHQRFAFPDDLQKSLNKLAKRIEKKYSSDDEEGRALRAIHEIRVTGEPSWDAKSIIATLTFLIDENELGGELTAATFEKMIEKWSGLCEPSGVIARIYATALPLTDFTAREYVDSDPLDLEYLSS